MSNHDYIVVYFDDEVPMKQALVRLTEKKERIIDVRTPFPVHGVDRILGMKKTRIPIGGFILGLLGAVLIFVFMSWCFVVSYPLIIGGKPYFAAPSFIPNTFEITVLFAGVSMAFAFLIRSKLKPDIRYRPLDEKITDNMFVILVDVNGGNTTAEKIREILSDIKPVEIRESEVKNNG